MARADEREGRGLLRMRAAKPVLPGILPNKQRPATGGQGVVSGRDEADDECSIGTLRNTRSVT